MEFFFGIVVILAVLFGLGSWVVLPVDRLARRRRQPVRYGIADFLCLFVSIQVPLGIVAWYASTAVVYETNTTAIRILAAIGFGTGTLVWGVSVRAMSRCGIYHGLPRVLFLGVIVPTVYYGLVPFSLATWACLLLIANGDAQQLFVDPYRWRLAMVVLLGCPLALCGVAVRKIVLAGHDQPLAPTDQ